MPTINIEKSKVSYILCHSALCINHLHITSFCQRLGHFMHLGLLHSKACTRKCKWKSHMLCHTQHETCKNQILAPEK